MSNDCLLKKIVDKSVLTDGFTIPTSNIEGIFQALGIKLEHGETVQVNLSIDGADYPVRLTNVNFAKDTDHIDVVQVRYSKGKPIAEHFREVFCYTESKVSEFYSTRIDTKRYIPPEDVREFLEIYASEKPNTLEVKCIPLLQIGLFDCESLISETMDVKPKMPAETAKKGSKPMSDISTIVIKFENMSQQVVGNNKKIVGLIKAKYMVPVIDGMSLEANPRSSATGAVTKAIEASIVEEPELFPFKTKGILLASSKYSLDDKNRVHITIDDRQIEGILDGGHNTLAIGLYILRMAMTYKGLKFAKGSKTWDKFKEMWNANREAVGEYLEASNQDDSITALDFFVPVELLVPANPDDKMCVDSFKNDLLEICAARNNNVQLQVSDKDNQRGYYDSLKAMMEQYDSSLCRRIEWKSNDGGEISINDIIALAWIPLTLISPIKDSEGKLIEPVSANKLYSGKGACLKQFERIMSSPDVTMSTSTDYKVELKNSEVISALRIAVEIPALFDYIYERFPEAYNAAGGSYGSIKAVKGVNKSKTNTYETPFTQKLISTASPEGFIMPLVYGLQALMERKEVNGSSVIEWKQQPLKILVDSFDKIVASYWGIIPICDYDPQKVGKAAQSYLNALSAFKMAVAGIL